ncbi:MAG TPA: tRNA adenosine(34) deaminase TadA [Thermodesulfobacteriota bacterium]|nr:tRNA adenosine(34) deaminase TadA [Thermodesulfobacteriota bacterium]
MIHDDEKFMRLAIREALKAESKGEVPVGAVIKAADGKVISRAHNLRESSFDPTAHAETIAIKKATKKLRDWRLRGTTLYVTLEPCAMCMGAIVLARIKRLVFGARDSKAGAVFSIYNIGVDNKLNHRVEVEEGILGDECSHLLKKFFENIRLEKPRRI